MSQLGFYGGWHHPCYPGSKYTCLGAADDCSKSVECARPNNYYTCKPCCNRQWFETKCESITLDDIQRAEARRRMGLAEPLPVHREMQKVFKEFRQRGGIVRILPHAEAPTVLWTEAEDARDRRVRRVTWPAHLVSDRLHGTAKEVATAERLASLLDAPYASKDA
jgi:hypothetical protein